MKTIFLPVLVTYRCTDAVSSGSVKRTFVLDFPHTCFDVFGGFCMIHHNGVAGIVERVRGHIKLPHVELVSRYVAMTGKKATIKLQVHTTSAQIRRLKLETLIA